MWDFNSIIFYFYLIFVVLAIWAVSQAWRSQACTETIHPFKAFVFIGFLFILLTVSLIVFSVYAGWSGYFSLHQSIFIFLLSLFLTYARFIEPHLVHVRQHQYRLNPDQPFTKSVKVALIADLHVGLYSGHERQLRIIVEKLNQAQPDIVVVAGTGLMNLNINWLKNYRYYARYKRPCTLYPVIMMNNIPARRFRNCSNMP
jgi:membrane protein YdbS with pleckstrin-like domain